MSATFGMIAGRVVGAAGAPVSGATVAAIGSVQPHHDIAAVTAFDGTFRFGSMLPGPYRVEARASGLSRAADVTLAPGGRTDVELTLADMGGATIEPLDPRVVGLDEDHRPFPIDLRERVAYRDYPGRCVCSLVITAANGVERRASGWLAAPRLVVTAGHNVYMPDAGGWAAQVRVMPGRNGDELPFGFALAGPADLRSVAGWTVDGGPDFDYGGIILPESQRFGDALGWLGFAPRSDADIANSSLEVVGYPADGGPGAQADTLWRARGDALDIGARQVRYAIRVDAGEDGAPVMMRTPADEPYCVAIHTWATNAGRGGVRVNGEVFDRLAEWSAQAP